MEGGKLVDRMEVYDQTERKKKNDKGGSQRRTKVR